MRTIAMILIGLSALALALAVLSTLTDAELLGVLAESYSRASANLALLAIALLLLGRGEGAEGARAEESA